MSHGALRHTAAHCNTLQHTTTQWKSLQHIVTHYSRIGKASWPTRFSHPVADCCRVLQTVAVIPRVWAYMNESYRTATHCNTLQQDGKSELANVWVMSHIWKATHCNTHCNTLQHTATHCNRMGRASWPTCESCHTYERQHTATHCNTLQHTATHCNRMGRASWLPFTSRAWA